MAARNSNILAPWRRLTSVADGESWSSSALALALGSSARTVQRAFDMLAAAGKVQAFGPSALASFSRPSTSCFALTIPPGFRPYPRAAVPRPTPWR